MSVQDDDFDQFFGDIVSLMKWLFIAGLLLALMSLGTIVYTVTQAL